MNLGVKGLSSITRSILKVLLSNFVSAGMGFAVTVLLARVLSKGDFGRINLIFAIVVVMYTVADFGFGNVVVIFYNTRKNTIPDLLASLNRYYFEFLVLTCLLMGGFLVAARGFYNLSKLEVFAILFSLICSCINGYFSAVAQALGDWRKFSILSIASNAARVLMIPSILMAGALALSQHNAALGGYIFQGLVLLILTVIVLRIPLRLKAPTFPRRDLWRLLWPLGLANICIIITMRYGVFLIEHVLGSEKLAVFSAANSLALVFPLITTSMMNVLLKEASAMPPQQFLEQLLRKQKKHLPLLAVAILVGMVVAKPATIILFGAQYSQAGGVPALMLIPYIGGIFFTPLETYFYRNNQKLIMWLRLIQMIVMIAVSLVLVRLLGLYSVVAGTIVSRLVGWMFIFWKAKNDLKVLRYVPSV